MKQCSKCGKLVKSFPKKSRRCQECRTASHRAYCKRVDYDKKRYWENPQAERERHYIRKYGVTIEQYEAMFLEQNGACAVCLRAATKTLDIDHCHATGKVRGLLCTNCNRMIGHAADEPLRLVSAAYYLRRKSPRNS